jgi:hypothetical protein
LTTEGNRNNIRVCRERQNQRKTRNETRFSHHPSGGRRRFVPAASSAVPASPDATLLIEIQKSLIRLGFDPGAVDGKLSQETIEAIRQYQAKGLLEDGNPSQPLLAHMLKNGG